MYTRARFPRSIEVSFVYPLECPPNLPRRLDRVFDAPLLYLYVYLIYIYFHVKKKKSQMKRRFLCGRPRYSRVFLLRAHANTVLYTLNTTAEKCLIKGLVYGKREKRKRV